MEVQVFPPSVDWARPVSWDVDWDNHPLLLAMTE